MPASGTAGVVGRSGDLLKGVPPTTPLASVLHQYKEAEVCWAHDKVGEPCGWKARRPGHGMLRLCELGRRLSARPSLHATSGQPIAASHACPQVCPTCITGTLMQTQLRREVDDARRRAAKAEVEARRLGKLAEHRAMDIKALKTALKNRDAQVGQVWHS